MKFMMWLKDDMKFMTFMMWMIMLLMYMAWERGCNHNEVMERLDSIEQSIDSTRHTK